MNLWRVAEEQLKESPAISGRAGKITAELSQGSTLEVIRSLSSKYLTECLPS
jgi:hypothetical protein